MHGFREHFLEVGFRPNFGKFIQAFAIRDSAATDLFIRR